MRTYKVYFEIFGKKMATSVLATDQEMAKRVIENKIIYHKIECTGKDKFTPPDFLKDFFKAK